MELHRMVAGWGATWGTSCHCYSAVSLTWAGGAAAGAMAGSLGELVLNRAL